MRRAEIQKQCAMCKRKLRYGMFFKHLNGTYYKCCKDCIDHHYANAKSQDKTVIYRDEFKERFLIGDTVEHLGHKYTITGRTINEAGDKGYVYIRAKHMLDRPRCIHIYLSERKGRMV